jgi:hypothetical protein
MKKIEAIIKPFKLDEVKEALQASRSPKPRDSGARKGTPNFIAVRSMWSIFCPR